MAGRCLRDPACTQGYVNSDGEHDCWVHGEHYVPGCAPLVRRAPPPRRSTPPTRLSELAEVVVALLGERPYQLGALTEAVAGEDTPAERSRVSRALALLQAAGVGVGHDRTRGWYLGGWRRSWGSRHVSPGDVIRRVLRERGGEPITAAALADAVYGQHTPAELERVWWWVGYLRRSGLDVRGGGARHREGYWLEG